MSFKIHTEKVNWRKFQCCVLNHTVCVKWPFFTIWVWINLLFKCCAGKRKKNKKEAHALFMNGKYCEKIQTFKMNRQEDGMELFVPLQSILSLDWKWKKTTKMKRRSQWLWTAWVVSDWSSNLKSIFSKFSEKNLWNARKWSALILWVGPVQMSRIQQKSSILTKFWVRLF